METKTHIYIDFEAISAPFSKVHKMNRVDMPYCYSLGIKENKKIKVYTKIINFQNIDVSDINKELRKEILSDVRKAVKDDSFDINKDTSVFVGYAPNLEKDILKRIFKDVRVKDIARGAAFSLSKATDKYYKAPHTYFHQFKKVAKESMDNKFFQSRGLAHDGALAALAGFVLFERAKNLKSKFTISEDKISTKDLLEELTDYSKDDVSRMVLISNNYEQYMKDVVDHIADVKEKNIVRKKNNAFKVMLNELNEMKKTSIDVEEIKEMISKFDAKLLK